MKQKHSDSVKGIAGQRPNLKLNLHMLQTAASADNFEWHEALQKYLYDLIFRTYDPKFILLFR